MTIENSIAQDSIWKKIIVDENLTISLPGKVETIDTFLIKDNNKLKFRLMSADFIYGTIVVNSTPNETNISVNNSESFDEALKGIGVGFKKSIEKKGKFAVIQDTIIDSLKGIVGFVYLDSNHIKPEKISFMFLLNDKMYSVLINYFPFESDQIENIQKYTLNKLLNSIHFNRANIKEQQFASRAESEGFAIGELIGFLIVFGGIISIIYYIIKVIKRKIK